MSSRIDRSAFVLIELALAVMVISVAILGLLSLLGSGVETVEKAAGEIHSALFAESVFNSLNTESMRATEDGRWELFWTDFSSGQTGLPVVAQELWQYPLWINAGQLYTNTFTNYTIRTPIDTNIVNNALRYMVSVEMVHPESTWTSRTAVTLRVWPDASGSTNRTGSMFYSEYPNWGRL